MWRKNIFLEANFKFNNNKKIKENSQKKVLLSLANDIINIIECLESICMSANLIPANY